MRSMVNVHNGSTVLLRRDNTQTLVVAVSATKTLSDYLRNYEVGLVPPPPVLSLPEDMRVHEGWAAIAVHLVEAEGGALFSKIDAHRLTDEPLRVVWAGHSLGAAVATLLATSAACRASDEARVLAVAAASGATRGVTAAADRSVLVTSGAPRVGNAAMRAVVKALTTHTSVVAEGDAVQQAPAYTSFRHHLVPSGSTDVANGALAVAAPRPPPSSQPRTSRPLRITTGCCAARPPGWWWLTAPQPRQRGGALSPSGRGALRGTTG